MSHHLRDRPLSDRDNWRLQNELGWQDALRFLDDGGIEPKPGRSGRCAVKRVRCHTALGMRLVRMRSVVIRTLARNGGDQSHPPRQLPRNLSLRPRRVPLTRTLNPDLVNPLTVLEVSRAPTICDGTSVSL